jgi:hypothetical protein
MVRGIGLGSYDKIRIDGMEWHNPVRKSMGVLYASDSLFRLLIFCDAANDNDNGSGIFGTAPSLFRALRQVANCHIAEHAIQCCFWDA